VEITASDMVRSSMEAYAKEVIEDRSLPDYRDGLKLSQRRILYHMWSEGLSADGNFKSSANVVGGVIGKLHPHGDIAVYDTMVRLNDNIVSPCHGDGDGWKNIHTEAAAMRYTKIKLSKFGDLFCHNIPVAEWIPNYSGDWKEPIVIPSPIPYALLAGTSGIAVAVATSIPGHNLTELVNTFILILNGERHIDNLIGSTLLAPESKTGGAIVSSLEEVRDLYRAGKGKIRWRCQYEMAYDNKEEEWSLIVTGIPEAFPLASWLVKMKSHAQTGMLQIENQSCADSPIRFVLTFNNVAFFYDVLEPSLYCSESYNFNLIAKAGERAEDISLSHHSLITWIVAWLTWREKIEIALVHSRLDKIKKDLHREQTKLWASMHIDEVITILKESRQPDLDLQSLSLSVDQIKIITEMQLQSISRLSRDRIEKSILSLTSELTEEDKKLAEPKLLIENTLRSLLKFDIGRVALVDYGDVTAKTTQTSLYESEGKPNFWAIETTRPKTLCMLGTELSLRKRTLNPYLSLVNAQHSAFTITEKGEVKKWQRSELVEKDIGYSYVALLPATYQFLILSCSGRWGNFLLNQKVSQWTTKLIQTGEDRILSAVGMNLGDILWVYSETHLEAVACDWEPLPRSNKTGWKLKNSKNIKLLVIPKEHTIVIDSVSYSFKDASRPHSDMIRAFLTSKYYYIYNASDEAHTLLCIDKDGIRCCLTGKELASGNYVDTVQIYAL